MSGRGRGTGQVRVTIRGQTYTVRSDEDDVDLEEVARYVDARITAVAEASRTLDDYSVALLTLMNVASDLRRLQRRVDAELAEVDRQLASIAVLVDAGAVAGGSTGSEG